MNLIDGVVLMILFVIIGIGWMPSENKHPCKGCLLHRQCKKDLIKKREN